MPSLIGLALLALLALLLMRARNDGSVNAPEVLGPEVTLLTQTRVNDGVIMLGARSTGEWVVGYANDDRVSHQEGRPFEGRPLTFVLEGVAVVAGQAPKGAVRYELHTDGGQVIKGRVENGAYLGAWIPLTEKPAFILRILDSKGMELYRWPPPGGLPAA